MAAPGAQNEAGVWGGWAFPHRAPRPRPPRSPQPHPEHRCVPGCTCLLSWRSLGGGYCRCPPIPGDPGNKGLPDSKSSQTRTGALHWRRPHPPALSCQPGQALPLTSSMAWGGGPPSPLRPGSHTCNMETTQRTSLLGLPGRAKSGHNARRRSHGSPRGHSVFPAEGGGGGAQARGCRVSRGRSRGRLGGRPGHPAKQHHLAVSGPLLRQEQGGVDQSGPLQPPAPHLPAAVTPAGPAPARGCLPERPHL